APRDRRGGEERPAVVLAQSRRAVDASGDREQVALPPVVVESSRGREQPALGVRAREPDAVLRRAEVVVELRRQQLIASDGGLIFLSVREVAADAGERDRVLAQLAAIRGDVLHAVVADRLR